MGVNFPNDEIFLTTEEVLEYLQVNLRTVYRLIKAGKIPAVRVGRQWRFRKRDIDAWLDTQRPRGERAAAVPVVALWRDSRTSGTVDQYDAGDTKIGEQGATFSWSSLSSGTYFLVKTNPADFGSTGTALGSGGTITKISNDVIRVVITSASSTNNRFLIASATGAISGTVYDDRDGNGAYTVGEPAKAGVQVYDDTDSSGTYTVGEPTATSDSGGAFSIGSLLPGTHRLRTVLPSGWVVSGTQPLTISLASGGSSTSNSLFVRQSNLTISGTVVDDANANGSQDGGETGLASSTTTVTVKLYRDNRITGTPGAFDGSDT